MKKLLLLILALLMVFCLAACEEPAQGDQVGASSEPSQEAGPVEGYAFVYAGVELIPGAGFDASLLPQCEHIYDTPNCALDGMDTVYNYGKIEVTVYTEDGSNTIQSVYIIDPNLATLEGLTLGSDVSTVTELYGSEYTANGSELQYAKGNMILAILTQDEYVVSIEYRIAG